MIQKIRKRLKILAIAVGVFFGLVKINYASTKQKKKAKKLLQKISNQKKKSEQISKECQLMLRGTV